MASVGRLEGDASGQQPLRLSTSSRFRRVDCEQLCLALRLGDLLFSRLERATMVRITPDKLRSWEQLIPRLGEREAAIALGGSQNGFRGARERSHAPPRKDKRGARSAISPALGKRIRALRDRVNKQGGHVTAKYVMRKLKIQEASLRSVQRSLGKDGSKYRNRPSNKILTAEEKLGRVQHCQRRLDEKFIYKGPIHARGKKRGIDVYVDCHSVDMPLAKAPKRSQKTWCTFCSKAKQQNESKWRAVRVLRRRS